MRVDFAALKEHAELWKTAYTESTFWFDIHYLVFAVTVLVSIGLVARAVWKWKLMKEEDALLRRGKGASA